MTDTATITSPIRPGLLGTLMAAVRPEFRAEEFAFDPADPVFGGGVCLVPSCARTARRRGLCVGHRDRWIAAGRPELESFATTTDPRWRKHRPLACCQAPGCGRGVARQGLCPRHATVWDRAGRPDRHEWLASVCPTVMPPGQQLCGIESCPLWAERNIAFCHAHGSTWKARGRPGIEEFARGYAEDDPVLPHERIRLEGLTPQLKLEIQYALQRRRDQTTGKIAPAVVMRVVRFLTSCPVTSLLDWPEELWRQRIVRPALRDPRPRAWLIFARRQLEDLADAGGGWDLEYLRDIWRMHNLGFEGRQTLRFDRIPQPWLKELAKRWTRWRISTGLCLDASRRAVLTLERFAQFLASPTVSLIRLGDLDRGVLERYLADLHAKLPSSQAQGTHIGLLNSFFTAIRQHHWDDTLPATVVRETHPVWRTGRPQPASFGGTAAQNGWVAWLSGSGSLGRYVVQGFWDGPLQSPSTGRISTVVPTFSRADMRGLDEQHGFADAGDRAVEEIAYHLTGTRAYIDPRRLGNNGGQRRDLGSGRHHLRSGGIITHTPRRRSGLQDGSGRHRDRGFGHRVHDGPHRLVRASPSLILQPARPVIRRLSSADIQPAGSPVVDLLLLAM